MSAPRMPLLRCTPPELAAAAAAASPVDAAV